jgi:CPA1 family monovalent cation:H+ antiporter
MASIELVISVFLLLTFIAALISIRRKVPYTLVLVLTGALISVTAALLSLPGSPFQALMQSVVDQIRAIYTVLIQGGGGGLFVGFVVPPLIFEAMIHVRGSDLRSVIKPSLALATVGVLIATLVGGLILWKLIGLSFYVSFLFAALIAPTDVVTVLEVFKRVKVPSKLATLMDTEAAFNDATAIVIFTIILSSIGIAQVTVINPVIDFAYGIGIGVLVGLVVGFIGEVLSSLIEDKVAETILTVVVVYGSFALASGIGASGLIAVAVAGLYFGNFTVRTAMEPATKQAVTTFWQIAAFLGNSVAFLLIGFQANLISMPQSIIIILSAYMAVLIARAATVYPIFAIFRKIGGKMQFVWSNIAMLGGVRGALSIALAATITASVLISENEINIISTMVFGVAFISILVQVPLLVRYTKRKMPETESEAELELDEQFAQITCILEEAQKLRAEEKITDKEFAEKLEETKDRIDLLIAQAKVTVETRKIIQERASKLFPSLPKKEKKEEKS